MSRFSLRMVLMAIIVVGLSASLFAQQTGSIVGTVTDKTGAVIPNAKVVLTNAATKDVRNTTSNGEGFFAFNGVVTGDYSVKIESSGFRVAEQSGIHISPGDRKNLNVELLVGKGSEQVTVEAEAAQIQVVDSGERSSVLSSRDIKNLALQGRDVTELVKTLPGFNNLTGMGGLDNRTGYDPTITGIASSVGNGYSASGTPNRSGTALTSDGANVIDPGCNCNATMTINADMVQEVKVSTSAYGADSAKGPVVISAVGKSGSSEYHGGAYLHFRDSSMNSTDWFSKFNKISKPKDRYWYPGGSFGGPVPYTNKKLLFWTGYENYRQSYPDQVTHGVVTTTVPTMSMRAGNFDPNAADNKALCSLGGWMPQCGGISSITPHGTGSSVTISNNNIASYIDPGGAAIMKEIVQPNFAPDASHPYNFAKSVMQYGNGYMFHTRVDYNISEMTKLYLSYNQQKDSSNIPVMLYWAPPNSQPFPGGFVAGGDSKTLSANLVKVFSPTLTNELIATLSYLNNTKSYSNPDAVSREALGYPYKGVIGGSKYMPMLSTQWWIPGYPMIYQQDADGFSGKKVTPAFTDNLTKVHGTHTLKLGFNWERPGNNETMYNEQNGNYAFGMWGASGNPVANILLAVPTYYEESNPNSKANVGYTAFGGYVQDDWKATKRLTLNLGMRFSHDPAWTDWSGKTGLATWTAGDYARDVATGITTLPGMRWNAIDSSVPLSGRTTQPLFVAPRFGLAYDVFGNGKTLLRGGWGAYYYHDSVVAGPLSTAMGGRMCTVSAATWLGDIDKGTNVSCGAVYGAEVLNPNDHKEPVTHTYNFTVSQQMPWKSIIEVAYSGNQTTNMLLPSGLQNKNVIPLGAFFGRNPVTGQIETIADIEAGKRVDANGNTVATITKDQYRPMQQYRSLYVADHAAWANYNSLQVSWNRPTGTFTYGINYVFSKTMGINGPADPVNVHNDYGIVNMDRTHVINATYSYELNTKFRGFMGSVVNGWMISGISSIQSGAPMAQAGSNNYSLQAVSKDPVVSGAKDYLHFKMNNSSILGSSDYTLMPTVTCNPAFASGGAYFNPSCFGVPAIGTNGAYQSPYVHGPAYWNSDLRMSKTFKVTERQNVQFSMAAFNFLNHPLTSFNSNDDSNRRLQFMPTVSDTTGTFDYAGYNGPYKLAPVSGNTVLGKPSIKYGRRVVEMSLKYNF